jgi:hypothetical protein
LFLVVPFSPFLETFRTQADIERGVSRATEESVETTRRRGFSILPLPDDFPHDEQDVCTIRIVDWDEQDAIRRRPP